MGKNCAALGKQYLGPHGTPSCVYSVHAVNSLGGRCLGALRTLSLLLLKSTGQAQHSRAPPRAAQSLGLGDERSSLLMRLCAAHAGPWPQLHGHHIHRVSFHMEDKAV
jgi:hypothetical protein